MKKHPGTAGTMPVKGTGCGIRPDLDEIGSDTGFDFSAAAQWLAAESSGNIPAASPQEASESTGKTTGNPPAKP